MTVNLREAQDQLPQLIDQLAEGQEVEITDNGRTVAKLVGANRQVLQARVPGLMKGMIHMSDDFDAPLDDFKEYMQ